MKLQKILVFATCVALAFVVGCDGGAKGRQAVSGTVTCNGVKAESGSVNFMPKAGTNGPSAGADIKDGVFAIEAKRGLMPGDYTVEIEAIGNMREQHYTDASGNDAVDMIGDSILPKKYQRGMGEAGEEIEATIVKGKNKIDFELND